MPILFAALARSSRTVWSVEYCIEGMMLTGAFCGFLGSYLTAAVGRIDICDRCAGLLSLLLAYLSISLGADQVISGIAINLLALGLITLLNRAIFGLRMIPYPQQF